MLPAVNCETNHQRGANYVLAAKDNHIKSYTLIAEADQAIETLPADGRKELVYEYCDIDKGHGRIETRHCTVIDWNQINYIARWSGDHSVAIVDSCREIGDSVSTQRRYFVSSQAERSGAIVGAIRAHWPVENGTH